MSVRTILSTLICAAMVIGVANAKDPVPPATDRSVSGGAISGTEKLAAPEFVTKVGGSDMYEIAAANLAISKATNPDVKAFAELMKRDHTKSTIELKTAITDSGLSTLQPPATLPSDKQSKLDELGKKTGPEFDKAYMEDQIAAHKEALNLLQGYSRTGDITSLKSFAENTAPIVQTHLEKAQMIQGKLGGMPETGLPSERPNTIPPTVQ